MGILIQAGGRYREGMSLRVRILLFLFLFGLVPLMLAVVINLPLVLERVDLFYRAAFLQNLRADFSDLDQHLASRDAMLTHGHNRALSSPANRNDGLTSIYL